MENYIRFDWAMKRLLRNKANHAVLEGLIETLLGRKYTIVRFLESEGNQEDINDKFNRVDILAESEKKELTIIEIQNTRELSYFHRMLYGVSKVITEYIDLGDDYEKVRKVYSINIVYFELGQGGDYVYHGKAEFRGLHNPADILKLSARQNKKFFNIETPKPENRKSAGALFPEYYILRVNDFDKIATTPLDEWLEFLKNGTIEKEPTAAGLAQAKECLRIDSLSIEEKRAYIKHMENLRFQRSVLETSRDEGLEEGREIGKEIGRKEGRLEGRQEGQQEEKTAIARKLKSMSMPNSTIAEITGLKESEIDKI